MFLFRQSSGELEHDGVLLGVGYSGEGEGKNSSGHQSERGVGPIPQGDWIISGPPIDSPARGPYVLHLFPRPGTEVFGRDSFLMHGDSIKHPGWASHGCIIMAHDIRVKVWESGDRSLAVVA